VNSITLFCISCSIWAEPILSNKFVSFKAKFRIELRNLESSDIEIAEE